MTRFSEHTPEPVIVNQCMSSLKEGPERNTVKEDTGVGKRMSDGTRSPKDERKFKA